MGISVMVTIITEKGLIHESFLSVFDMMRSKPAYTENDAQTLKTLTDEKHSIRIQKVEIWNDDKLKAKTMAFPSQHELTQTDAHFKFKGKQKRTNKFASVQVNPTTNSIQNQWLEDIKENNQNPTYNFNSTETRLGL